MWLKLEDKAAYLHLGYISQILQLIFGMQLPKESFNQTALSPQARDQKVLRISSEILTAATGMRISTNNPARACFMSLSFTSRKYWAHS